MTPVPLSPVIVLLDQESKDRLTKLVAEREELGTEQNVKAVHSGFAAMGWSIEMYIAGLLLEWALAEDPDIYVKIPAPEAAA